MKPIKNPLKISSPNKGSQQETVDFRSDLSLTTGGDVNNRRNGEYGKDKGMSTETLKSILDL